MRREPFTPIVEPFVRTNVSLPEPVHRRLKVRAATERATMQALMRAALAPLLAEGAPPPCRVVAVVNPRAGVGRTTVTLGLGRAIAAGGQRTLLVDLDPEAGLTRAAGLEPDGLEATVADLLAPGEDGPPRPAVVLRPLGERLALLPAGPALARAELELLLAGGRERALAEALRPVLADHDVALLDCPPSLGLLTLMALVAADQALVPVAPGGADARELGGLLGGARPAAGEPPRAAPGDDRRRGHAGRREDGRDGGDARRPGARGRGRRRSSARRRRRGRAVRARPATPPSPSGCSRARDGRAHRPTSRRHASARRTDAPPAPG